MQPNRYFLLKIGILLLIGLSYFVFSSCNPAATNEPLPILGERTLQGADSVYHTISAFKFMNQDSQIVNNATFAGKAYVADFFFVSCPTICPKVARQMKRVYDRFLTDDRIGLISHSLDTRHDTIPRLKKYAEDLGVKAPKWHFVTGTHDEVFGMADDYFSVTLVDPDAPGGFNHSGKLLLVDTQGRIRAFCEGTDPKDVDEFMAEMDKLLVEMEK
jgi:protein SCO1